MVTLFLALSLCQPPDTAPLIKSLGGTYRERTDATKRLQAMGEAARPALQKAALDDDLEISRRAGMLLYAIDQDRRRRAMALIDEAFPSLPWLDMAYIMPCDSKAQEALGRYYEAACDAPEARANCPHTWGRYRQACRLLCYELAESGVPLVVIRAMVAELAAREEAWCVQNGFVRR